MKDFWQKVKNFFKKFWHFVTIGVLAAAVIALTVVMCVCMVPKGSGSEGGNGGNGGNGGGGDPEVVTFNAPASVAVEGKTLTWSATEGATSGYTVKINNYELLTGGTSLSLASAAVTAHLNYGDNELAVRVNAVYNKQQSAYSTAVKYNYDLPANVKTFLALVSELGDDVTAEGVGDKVAAVREAYEAMIEEERILEEVREPKSQFDTFAAQYEAYCDAQEFKAQVEAIDITATTADDDILAAETAYGGLSATAKEYAAETNTALATKKTERAAYKQGVADATAEFTAIKTTVANYKANAELSDDEKNEAIIAAIAEKGTYAENVLTNTAVAALLNEINSEDKTAKDAIEDLLDTLKTSIEAKLAADEPNEANYNALTAEEGKIAALGDYAKSQFETVFGKTLAAVKESLADAKTTMLNTPVETIVSDSASTVGAARMVYITVQFKDFNGKLITEMKNLPVVKLEQTGAQNAKIMQQLTVSGTGAYIAIIKMEPFADITSASYSVGDIEDAQDIEIDVTPVLGNNPWFTTIEGTDGFRDAFDETGIKLEKDGFTANYSNGKVYLEIYEEGAVKKDGDFVVFNGSPIVGKDGMTRIDVTDWDNFDKLFEVLNRRLALDFGDYFIGKPRSVHFVIYGEAEVDGKISRTAVKADTVSSAKKFELTDDDRYYGLLTIGKNGAVTDDNIWFSTVAVMGMMADGSGAAAETGYSLNGILSNNGKSYQFANADSLKNDFCIRLTMNGTLNGEAWEQVLYLNLGENYKFADLVKLCSLAYYKANPNVSENVTVSDLTFKACYHVREDANADVKALFKLSREWEVTGLSTSMKINRACAGAPAAIALSDNGWVIMIRDLENKYGGAGNLLVSGKAKYVKYEFYNKADPGTKYTMYLFLNEENKAEFYKEINEDGTPKGAKFTLLANTDSNDAGVPIGDFITNLTNAFTGINFSGNWVFTDQYVLAEGTSDMLDILNVTEFLVGNGTMTVVTPEESAD